MSEEAFMPSIGFGNRLFTYKVAYDGGSAPNPYGGICSLAICKPKIRSVAVKDDIVVGFGCNSATDPEEGLRVVYAMVVKRSLSWADYVHLCNSDKSYRSKIPKSDKHQGDCIWLSPRETKHILPSSSGHKEHDCERDVLSGRNVLLSSQFWYFGKGDKYRFVLDESLSRIVPRGQGHRSNANTVFRDEFVNWFNQQIRTNNIHCNGLLGKPADYSPVEQLQSPCSSRREEQIVSDESGEELE